METNDWRKQESRINIISRKKNKDQPDDEDLMVP